MAARASARGSGPRNASEDPQAEFRGAFFSIPSPASEGTPCRPANGVPSIFV